MVSRVIDLVRKKREIPTTRTKSDVRESIPMTEHSWSGPERYEAAKKGFDDARNGRSVDPTYTNITKYVSEENWFVGRQFTRSDETGNYFSGYFHGLKRVDNPLLRSRLEEEAELTLQEIEREHRQTYFPFLAGMTEEEKEKWWEEQVCWFFSDDA